jgi:hypothetical protein
MIDRRPSPHANAGLAPATTRSTSPTRAAAAGGSILIGLDKGRATRRTAAITPVDQRRALASGVMLSDRLGGGICCSAGVWLRGLACGMGAGSVAAMGGCSAKGSRGLARHSPASGESVLGYKSSHLACGGLVAHTTACSTAELSSERLTPSAPLMRLTVVHLGLASPRSIRANAATVRPALWARSSWV